MVEGTIPEVLALLDAHHEAFNVAKSYADKTCHPVPSDTRAWSQILVSLLTGINGLQRKKGPDLVDGSDVKGANCWSAIDTPRFNGAIPAGRKSKKSKKPGDVSALNNIPYIFFVLWDDNMDGNARCRVWCVRSAADKAFRRMCKKWYGGKARGAIKSDNFQLHPPRYRDEDVFTNECGNLSYPLLFSAIRRAGGYKCVTHDPDVLTCGQCKVT